MTFDRAELERQLRLADTLAPEHITRNDYAVDAGYHQLAASTRALLEHLDAVAVVADRARAMIAGALVIIDRDVEALANIDPWELKKALGGYEQTGHVHTPACSLPGATECWPAAVQEEPEWEYGLAYREHLKLDRPHAELRSREAAEHAQRVNSKTVAVRRLAGTRPGPWEEYDVEEGDR